VIINGEWQTVASLTPRDLWAMEAVNLTQYISQGQNLSVRLLWTSPHNIDYIGLDTTPQDAITEIHALLVSATHSVQGDVTLRLLLNDNFYTELLPQEQIQLKFILPNKPQNKTRTFIFFTNGHYEKV
jgi:hypothetical protein